MNVIFDLDGTLANIDHRTHFVRGDRRNWPAFFAACVDDLPVPHVIASFKAHQAAGHRVRIWSGRSDVVRAETEAWLADVAGIDPRFLEHMRAADDGTPDATLKRYWLQQAEHRPDLVYDDRQRVVDMWRAETAGDLASGACSCAGIARTPIANLRSDTSRRAIARSAGGAFSDQRKPCCCATRERRFCQ